MAPQNTYPTIQHVYSNHNNAAEYQVSSIPYSKTLTIGDGVLQHIRLPFVSRFLVIYAASADVKLMFSSTGDVDNKTNYFVVKSGTSTERLELKCREFWIKNSSGASTSVSILAGLTNIPHSQFPNLEGENIDGIG